MNIQLERLSQREHTNVTGTQIKEENIARAPETSILPCQSLSAPKVILSASNL